MKCPKCQGEVEEGFIADRSGDFAFKTRPEWATDSILAVGLKNAKK